MKIVKFITVLFALITTLQAAPKNVALDGYCPVCYIAAGKAAKGDSKITSEYDGKTYYFVSEDVKGMFDAEPKKWLPQYDGYCAYGMALGKKFESDPKAFTVVDGKLYLNKNKSISKKFNEDTKGFITKADKHWAKM
jgi:YHS domain-containing protein